MSKEHKETTNELPMVPLKKAESTPNIPSVDEQLKDKIKKMDFLDQIGTKTWVGKDGTHYTNNGNTRTIIDKDCGVSETKTCTYIILPKEGATPEQIATTPLPFVSQAQIGALGGISQSKVSKLNK